MNFIVAVDEDWAIGKDGDLLFHISPDMKYFREKTKGKVVVMGEATLKSLPGGKPLAGRTNLVLSDDAAFTCEGVELCRSMEQLFEAMGKYESEDIFVIGGASVYNQLMDCCDTAYITKVKERAPHDAAINPLDGRAGWRIAETSQPLEHEGIEFTFNVYKNDSVKARPDAR